MSSFILDKVIYGPEAPPIPGHLSYSKFIIDCLKNGGDKIALLGVQNNERITYRYLLQSAVNVSMVLRDHGMVRGDCLSICCENRHEFLVISIATIFNGGTIASISPYYIERETEHVLNLVKPKFAFFSEEFYKKNKNLYENQPFLKVIITCGHIPSNTKINTVEYLNMIKHNYDIGVYQCVDVDLNHVGLIMTSSGTTGLPKGVMHTQLSQLISAVFFQNLMDIKMKSDMSVLQTLPWFHLFGFSMTMNFLCFNKPIIYLTRFNLKDYLEAIQQNKISILMTAPPIVVLLAKHALVKQYDLSTVREIWCGAAPLQEELADETKKRLTNLTGLLNTYGMTEMAIGPLHRPKAGRNASLIACKLLCGTKAKILDLKTGEKLGPNQEGELCFKCNYIMKGYINNVEATNECTDNEGYLKTGDIAYYDNDGFIYVVDRVKELIKFKGFQVPPAELESILLKHKSILDCGVVGKPDQECGELPLAFVVRKPGSTITEEEIVVFVSSRVSSPKQLRGGVIFIENIPKNPSGKILRKELRLLLNKSRSKL